MRAFEIVLSLMNIVTFAALAVPRLGTVRWTGVVAAAAALATCLQLLAEGPRWQMLPAYVLAVAFLVVWLAGLAFAWRLRDGGVIAGFAVGLGALVLAASLALPVALPVFRFPRPTGPYAIGSVTYHWVDASRPELFTTDPNDHRELMAQVWYPAKDEPSAPRVQHMENADAISAAMARIVHLPRFFFAHFKYVMTNAVSHAPLADDKRAYPACSSFSPVSADFAARIRSRWRNWCPTAMSWSASTSRAVPRR
jgi:hypothetical protein